MRPNPRFDVRAGRPLRALTLTLILAAFLAPSTPRAQATVRVEIALPAAPPLVVVQPGVQVVADFDEEVFFSDNAYWLRRDGRWYRSHEPRAAFVFVDTRIVPRALVTLEPGQYRHYRAAAAPAPAYPPQPPPRMAPAPPPPPPTRAEVLQVKEIKAGRVRARVIYAKEVKAKGGRIGRVYESGDDDWEKGGRGRGRGRGHGRGHGHGDGKIEAPEVIADVIYAKEVDADWIEAGEIHAKDVKIER